MAAPISFIYGNCVFARGLHDPWAAYVLEPRSYAWLEEARKIERMQALVGALEAVRSDVQVVRVRRHWDPELYVREMDAREMPHARARRSYLRAHADRLADAPVTVPVVFMFVSIREQPGDMAAFLAPAGRGAGSGLRAAWRRIGAAAERRVLSASELERSLGRAEQMRLRLGDFLPVRSARMSELQWLVRRSFCRGLGEPEIDGLHEPAAVTFERNGAAVVAPLEGDVMAWTNSFIEAQPRRLRVESELGVSWQAHLMVGALPDSVMFPGAQAELMFAPGERLAFPIDVTLCARFLPNDAAQRMARRRVQDADQIARAESGGELGLSDIAHERTERARELLTHLQHSRRPPLLRTSISIAVAAATETDLEERVQACRRAFGEVRLHRPFGEQARVFTQHLPAQRTRVGGYEGILTTEQVGALMPCAAHRAGSSRGFYLGNTVSGSRQPVRLDLREGSETDGNTTILSVGALGSGKSTLAQKLCYEGFLDGARVIDCDPKGDHRFHLLDDVAPNVESVTLRPDPGLRGLLDPLRVAPVHLRHDAAVSYLLSLLPTRAEPAWETALVRAVDAVISRASAPTCLEVVRALSESDGPDAVVGRALEVYARSGLTQLGFGDPAVRLPAFGEHQVTYLPIRDLPGPGPELARSDYSQAERVGEQIVRLIAMFAMQLMGRERDRLKLFSFDEGWRLLGDPAGRALLGSLQRMGRSELAVPIISTQLVSDALVGERESLSNLIGATFAFGMRSEAECARALDLLGLDPADERMRRALMSMRAGRCLFRDHSGRVEAIQVDLVIPALARRLSTTPAARAGRGARPAVRG